MTASPATAVDVRWFVCHTKPRCEKKLSALLEAEGFEHYLPLVTSVKRYGKATKRFTKPLFPGYVFAHVIVSEKSRIYQQDLLARVLPVEDEKKFLRQMDDVRTIVASGLELTVRPLIKRGTRVRVSSGPLWGLEGIVDDPTTPTGIILCVDVLQQGLLVKLPLESLEILP
ncbi:MAG TPA: transcription termination/antitermination NusG family protein [Rariglobus sp.]|nr:transcription termination/antitermination NusG family protein [Rariglobus sp.]